MSQSQTHMIHGGCLLALVTPSPSRTPTLSALRFFSYASGSFDYEISSAVYEGRPITTIVFVSVFIPVGGEFGVPVSATITVSRKVDLRSFDWEGTSRSHDSILSLKLTVR